MAAELSMRHARPLRTKVATPAENDTCEAQRAPSSTSCSDTAVDESKQQMNKAPHYHYHVTATIMVLSSRGITVFDIICAHRAPSG